MSNRYYSDLRGLKPFLDPRAQAARESFLSRMSRVGPSGRVSLKYTGPQRNTSARTGAMAKMYAARSLARYRTSIPRSISYQPGPGYRGEVKGMDTSLIIAAGSVITTTSTNAASFVLNLCQTGTGSWNRVGKKITMKSVRLVGNFVTAIAPQVTTGNINDQLIRMVIIYDRQPSGGSIPTYDSIFGVTDQSGTESCPDIWCPPRYDNMERFRILRDCTYDADLGSIGSGGTTNAISIRTKFDEYIKLKGLDSVFLGQSNPMTIADISTGALYVFFRALVNTATNCQTSVDGNARLRYHD